jgi:hypothetical protein
VIARGLDIWKLLISTSLKWYLERSSWYLSRNLGLCEIKVWESAKEWRNAGRKREDSENARDLGNMKSWERAKERDGD